MGAFLTRHRFLEHQEKIKKAIESYKKKKEKKLKHPQNNGNTISATPLPSVYGAEDIDNDGYYTAEEKRRYEMTLEIKQEDESFPEPIRWTRGELIGHGAFGKVYLGMNIESGSLMAVKEIALRPTLKDDEIRNENELLIRDVETEVSMLKDLSHPNIVRYIGTGRTTAALLVYMEYVPGGSIAELLRRFGCFSERIVRVYTRQILEGVEHLHRYGIMHRDIKGANILVDKNGTCKVSDFGAARSLSQIRAADAPPSLRGTPYWMAPEVIKQIGHGRQADVWSIGCTVLEMLSGKPPWSRFKTVSAALYHIAQTNETPHIPPSVSPGAKKFIAACTRRDPRIRPNCSRLLTYEFVSKTSSNASTPTSRRHYRGKSSTSKSLSQPDIMEGTSALEPEPQVHLGKSITQKVVKRQPRKPSSSSVLERRGFPAPRPLQFSGTPPTEPGENSPCVPWGDSESTNFSYGRNQSTMQSVETKEILEVPPRESKAKELNKTDEKPSLASRSPTTPDSVGDRPLLGVGRETKKPPPRLNRIAALRRPSNPDTRNPATREMIKEYLVRQTRTKLNSASVNAEELTVERENPNQKLYRMLALNDDWDQTSTFKEHRLMQVAESRSI
eukprot:CAMPEP_0167789100 /NCGR_PEP_ID=MMETSP0111_2-20121227/10464_1 /TAXON_ID=91324 /ORGANISM="Lotharella globosa, Strain CCCM811" /LENGTH=615 /DNA_ID=CAMNT_0007681163 /DNA_START=29 /DNA_END=1877 /DNA_ORIENTATION=-